MVKKYKKAGKKLKADYDKLAKLIPEFMQNEETTKFILFAIAVQCGGNIEISNDTVEIAKKMSVTHELTLLDTEEAISYGIKRREEEPNG